MSIGARAIAVIDDGPGMGGPLASAGRPPVWRHQITGLTSFLGTDSAHKPHSKEVVDRNSSPAAKYIGAQ
jgi:hypothetical protein